MPVRIEAATADDAEILTQVSRRAFEHDIHFGAPRLGGPPGYDSTDWQLEAIRNGRFFKISSQGRIIGGFVVFSLDLKTAKLGRAFLDPEFQNMGIGRRLLGFAERVYPRARRIVLDTPVWNLRNRHFYERAGYVKVGEIDAGEGFLLCQYEKRING